MDSTPFPELPFGELLRRWRRIRRMSQLDLAGDAEVSARHVSFLETGRSHPSREMVLILASALDIPLRERNGLLASAGYVAAYAHSDLGAAALAPVRRAIAWTLRQQEPFPAVVMNRRWDVLSTNGAAERLFSLLLDGVRAPAQPPNVLRLMFHPEQVRPWVANWDAVAATLLQRVHREAIGGVLDAETRAVLDEIRSYAPARLRDVDVTAPTVPVVPVHFRKGELDLRFFSTVLTLGTPRDVTAEEIRIEGFFPEDEGTELRARALLG